MTLRRTLLIWLLGGLFTSTVCAGAAAFFVFLHAADGMFDRQLAHIASNLPETIVPQFEPRDNGNPYDDIFLQVWDASGARTYPIRPSVRIPVAKENGYHSIDHAGRRWRVYTELQHNRLVQVAQPVDSRRSLALDFALGTTGPFLLLIPLLGIIIWNAVGRSAASIGHLAEEMKRRSAVALQPLPTERIPGELLPMVAALNDLLARLGLSMSLQRSFIADAAHELRSPVTALKLHLQLMERAATEAQRQAGFVKVRERVDRIVHLVEQLLQLAREEPRDFERSVLPLSLTAMLQGVLKDFELLAENAGVSLSCSGCERDVEVRGQADSLRVLFSNLVDNAIRYTGRDGHVWIAIDGETDELRVHIDDDGPGIAVEERSRVFDRFHRLAGSGIIGSGLGLAIVKAIADRHGCSVVFEDRPGGPGLRVTVAFPKASNEGNP